jgi:hypothetical protein
LNETTFVIPNWAESPVRNLLFAGQTSNSFQTDSQPNQPAHCTKRLANPTMHCS